MRNWASRNAGNVDDQLKMLRYVGARAVSDAIRFVLSGSVELGVVALLPGPSFWRRYNRVGTRRSLKLSGSPAPDWATTVRSVSGVMQHLTAGTRVRPVSQGDGGEEEERLDRAKPTDTNPSLSNWTSPSRKATSRSSPDVIILSKLLLHVTLSSLGLSRQLLAIQDTVRSPSYE